MLVCVCFDVCVIDVECGDVSFCDLWFYLCVDCLCNVDCGVDGYCCVDGMCV